MYLTLLPDKYLQMTKTSESPQEQADKRKNPILYGDADVTLRSEGTGSDNLEEIVEACCAQNVENIIVGTLQRNTTASDRRMFSHTEQNSQTRT